MSAHPHISVVVPTFRRPARLAACLHALRQSDFPADQFEIVVVDDGNVPQGYQAVRQAAVDAGVRWVRLPENAGPAAARNEGARAARGTYLAFLDDDCLADRRWLGCLKSALDANPGAAVGGTIAGASDGSLNGAADQAILDVAYEYYNADPAHAAFLSAANLAVPAGAFREFGGFDPSLRTSEDREFCARWLADGRRLVYAAAAVATHTAPGAFPRFWRRHFAYGDGAYRFRSRYTRSANKRIRLEPVRFYRRLVFAPYRHGFSPRAAAVSCLIAISQIASACGFLAARRRAHVSKGRTA